MRFAVPLEIDPACFATWRQDSPIIKMDGETMGTAWRIQLAAHPQFDNSACLTAINARLETILAQMSHWREDSLLGQFNRANAGTWHHLPPEFAEVMAAALKIAEQSQGAFDPTIGALVNLWGHGPVPIARLPLASEVERTVRTCGFSHLVYEHNVARLRQSGNTQLDFSGIAKGYAVDALAHVLRDNNVHHALVEIGGELVGMGLRPDGNPWWVELETPAKTVLPLRVALHQLAVATSGDYVRGQHTIDPRTGYPVEHAMAVSVIHNSAMIADAWATALSVLAPAPMKALTIQENLIARALIRDGQAICEWISPALQAMIEPDDEPQTA